jgi:hypothetical protein
VYTHASDLAGLTGNLMVDRMINIAAQVKEWRTSFYLEDGVSTISPAEFSSRLLSFA